VRALVIADGRLRPEDRPQPEPTAGQVVVRVEGAGLNRADLAQRAGHYPAPPGSPPDIPGMEFAGRVVAHGPGTAADAPAIGAAVFGIVGGGAQAEYVAVDASHCAPVPDGLDVVAMGGVPEAFITSHDAMVTQAGARADDWVLVHAVGSGVGTASLQLARTIGARVVGTSRTADKLERCQALGLDVGIEAPHDMNGRLDVDALAWSIVEATGGGANVTLDLVGGDYLAVDLNAAAPQGRVVLIGTMGGGATTISLGALLGKRLHVIGTVLRGRSVAEKASATRAFVAGVVPHLASEAIEPVIDVVMPLDDGEQAYDLLASNTTFGKIVLDCR
jgi:NADPH2:quinone reductase